MIKSLKEFLASNLAKPDSDSKGKKSIELCAAVLMLEISLADSHLHDDEQRIIKDIIQHHFHLDAEETQTLFDLAAQEVDHAVSLYDFTRMINDNLSLPEKIRIIELLWHVANADAVIDKHEEYFIRKIADLLYVPHSDYIKAKLKAGEEAE